MAPCTRSPHHAAARRGRLVAALVFLVSVSLAGPVDARGPSKKQIDEAMLRLPASDLVRVTEAEEAIQQADTKLDEADRELDIARKDDRGARAWVDASSSVLKAIELDRKAAETAARSDDLNRLATMQVRSEASLKWRRARADAAKHRISYLQARIAWTKSELSRLNVVLKEAKLLTYKASVESTSDIDDEIAKVGASRSKAEANADRARVKMEKAEFDWQSAAATAKALAPGRR